MTSLFKMKKIGYNIFKSLSIFQLQKLVKMTIENRYMISRNYFDDIKNIE